MADYTPIYSAGAQPWTATTSGAVVGGNTLIASGSGTVAVSGADSAVVVGVAAHDAASGAKVTVWPIESVVHELVATLVFNTIMNLTTQAAQVACFHNAAAPLEPEGCFVVEVGVPICAGSRPDSASCRST